MQRGHFLVRQCCLPSWIPIRMGQSRDGSEKGSLSKSLCPPPPLTSQSMKVNSIKTSPVTYRDTHKSAGQLDRTGSKRTTLLILRMHQIPVHYDEPEIPS